MKRSPRTLRLGGLVLGAALLLTATGHAQGVPEGKAGPLDPGQTQRERTPIDLSTIDKPKPEIEIYTGPDVGGAPPRGIVIVPEEAVQPPSSPSPNTKEQAAPPKKKDD
jgi:hypothetical protein